MSEDRHQAVYIPFRCSQETEAAITRIAQGSQKAKSEILRDLVEKGLVSIGAKTDEDYLQGVIRHTVQEVMKPQVERLAAISAKAAQISGAAFFMSMYMATKDCPEIQQQGLQEAAASARELGIQYLKLKDQNIDDFIREGVKSIADDPER